MEGDLLMELSKRIPVVLYLDRDRCIYLDSSTGMTLQYIYSTGEVSDLEVINQELLRNNIATFIQANKVVPTQLVIVLSSSLLFEKKIPISAENTGKNDPVQQFVDTVPFESVSFTKYTTVDATQVIAASTDFFSAMKQAFEKQGFTVTYVFPVHIFAEDLSAGITAQIAQRIIAKIDSVKQYNLLRSQQEKQVTEKKEPPISQKQSKNRLYILIVVFASLLIVLVVVYVMNK